MEQDEQLDRTSAIACLQQEGWTLSWGRPKVPPMTMFRLLRIVAALIVMYGATATAQNLPQPILKAAPLPMYPPIAREARIEGTVRVSFVLNEAGDVVEVKALSGHPTLTPRTLENVKAWHFSLPQALFRTEWKYETEFVYRLSGREVDSYNKPTVTVSWSSFERIEITSDTIKPVVQY